MTDYEKKVFAKELLRTRSQDEVLGDFQDVVDGVYDVTISNVYESLNVNGKPFIGIKSTIKNGEYAGDFFVDCLYFNDESYERGIQRVRNILLKFGLPDLSEDDIDNERILERISAIRGKITKILVETNGDMKTYEYGVE